VPSGAGPDGLQAVVLATAEELTVAGSVAAELDDALRATPIARGLTI